MRKLATATLSFATALLATLFLLASCAQQPLQVGETEVRYGRVTRVDNVQIDSPAHFGLGAIIGSVAGGLLGNQIGGGTGRDVATVAAALGGAMAGSSIETRTERQSGQHITVALNNGVAVGITQPASDLRVGDQVRIDGSGPGARVTRY